MSRPWLVIVLVIYGVVAAISMIVLGWPESNPTQVVLLELAALPLQAALALGLWHLSRRTRPLGSRGRVTRWIAIAIGGLGVLAIGLAYLTGPRGLVHLGLALVWLGLLVAMLLVVSHLPRRPVRELFRVLPDSDDEDDEDEDEEPAVVPGMDDPEDPSDGPAGPPVSLPVEPQDRAVEPSQGH